MPKAPAPAPSPSEPIGGEDSPVDTLTSRLNPEQLAALDAMNAGFGGPQLGDPASEEGTPAEFDDDAPVLEAGKPDEKPPAAAAPPPPEKFDDFIPPAALDTPPAAPDAAAPPKEEAPPSEFKTAEELMPDEAIDKLRTEKQKQDVREWRKHYNAMHDTLRKAQARAAELEKNAPVEVDARVKQLEAHVAELNAIVERKALEEHPFVIERFVQPRQNALDFGHKALEMAELDPSLLDKAIGLTGKERVAALDQLYDRIESKSILGKVEKAVAVIEGVDDQRQAFFAEREANFAKMKAQEEAAQARTLAEQETKVTAVVDKIVDHLAKKEGFSFLAFSDKPGAEPWNDGLKTDLKAATEFLLKNTDAEKLITAAVLAQRAPRMQIAFNKILAENLALKKAQAQRQTSTPRLTPNGTIDHTRSAGAAGEGLVAAGKRALNEVLHGE